MASRALQNADRDRRGIRLFSRGSETRVFSTPLSRARSGRGATTGARHTRAREMERVRAHRAVAVEGRSLARARVEARRCARARAVTRGDDADVVVVGSGIGGLTAAAMLAYYGKKVRCARARAIGVGRTVGRSDA